ncbi:MAG: M18 family aminopeptidase [Ilumatobacter sp.]|uniref:M18 family aminopeptidase n=1 Tax=Ilumatobacter sp. TaxID=1967498 RepID=UPI002631C438|nr:M18 family aminopeptidase [Ilumatobacter sp.]MDJ0769921.1 M18 family aminopeptidase [Ilumatobacter sp.]
MYEIDDLCAYLDGSPSPFHAARTAADRLGAAGFAAVADGDDWSDLPAAGFVLRDGSVIAWRTPADARSDAPFRLAGAHTDSPCLRVKPRPDVDAVGWRQLNVEVYGGILNNSWLDRDLGVAGRLTSVDGEHVLVDVRRPIARVPQLAVHLDRGVNDSLKLDPQQHLRPVWGSGSGEDFASWIAEQAGTDRPAFWELCLYDTQPAAVLGGDESLLASGRLDNQVSCWAAVEALIAAEPTDAVAVIVLNDHEEVGSASTTGAAGALLERVLERHVAARGGDRDDLLRALATSSCISADNAHAVHPNYVERHDPEHRPLVNAGPAIKINSNQRYATSSATAARFRRACETASVPFQVFVSRNNMPCGSTIGPITATRLGIDTVDVGVPQLSMHSARELCGVSDPPALAAALHAAFAE